MIMYKLWITLSNQADGALSVWLDQKNSTKPKNTIKKKAKVELLSSSIELFVICWASLSCWCLAQSSEDTTMPWCYHSCGCWTIWPPGGRLICHTETSSVGLCGQSAPLKKCPVLLGCLHTRRSDSPSCVHLGKKDSWVWMNCNFGGFQNTGSAQNSPKRAAIKEENQQ